MKKIFLMVLVTLAVLSVGSAQQKNATPSSTARQVSVQSSSGLNVGERGPGGGIIVYKEGNKYVECSEILGKVNWDDAVSLCSSYRGGGYDDWYLPTRAELEYIYTTLRSTLPAASSGWYWSSSQRNAKYAWVQRFSTGQHYGAFKSNLYFVRGIRTFTR